MMGRSKDTAIDAGGYVADGTKTVYQLRNESPLPVNLDKLKFPDAEEPAYEMAAIDPDDRNRLQEYLKRVSGDVCQIHKSDILAVSSTVNASLSGITTILGGVGAIVTGATAARILSGSAGISNALKEDLNQNVYYNNFATAINRQIDAQRAQKWQEIQPKQSLGIKQYSVDAAIADIAAYHNLCSFSEAVDALATGDKRPASADELRGRLTQMEARYKANLALIDDAKTPKAKKTLEDTNEALARMMQVVTMQLGLVQGVPEPMTPSDAESGVKSGEETDAKTGKKTTTETKPTKPDGG